MHTVIVSRPTYEETASYIMLVLRSDPYADPIMVDEFTVRIVWP